MKNITSIFICILLFFFFLNDARAETKGIEDPEDYKSSHSLFVDSEVSLRQKLIKLNDLFKDKTAMYQLMTPDGVAYLQTESALLQMLLIVDMLGDLTMLGVVSHYENELTGNIDSFYSHYTRTKAMPVFNGADRTLRHMMTIASDEKFVLFIRKILLEDVNPNLLYFSSRVEGDSISKIP